MKHCRPVTFPQASAGLQERPGGPSPQRLGRPKKVLQTSLQTKIRHVPAKYGEAVTIVTIGHVPVKSGEAVEANPYDFGMSPKNSWEAVRKGGALLACPCKSGDAVNAIHSTLACPPKHGEAVNSRLKKNCHSWYVPAKPGGASSGERKSASRTYQSRNAPVF